MSNTKSKLIGHKSVRDFLLSALKKNTLNHAYLVIGPKNIGKTTLVQNFLQILHCSDLNNNEPCNKCGACQQVQNFCHSDVWWIKRTVNKQDISIEQIRELLDFTQLTSLSGKWRAVVIEDTGDLNKEAGNALLKVLEEPAHKVIFFLIDHKTNNLLSTLRSRCIVLQLGLVPPMEIFDLLTDLGLNNTQAKNLSQQAGGRPGVAISLFNDSSMLEQRQELAQEFIKILTGGHWHKFQEFLELQFKEKTLASSVSILEKGSNILKIWSEVARDLLLIKLGLSTLVHYYNLQNELNQVAQNKSVLSILKICLELARATRKLASNANPKLTFEWLCLTLQNL
jgi:DNA polymerase-3 subunit delta'